MDFGPHDHIILIAHGSGIAQNDARMRHSLLRQLALSPKKPNFDLAFINGAPRLQDIIDCPRQTPLNILPLCLADGKFYRQIIPQAISEATAKPFRILPPLFHNINPFADILTDICLSSVAEHQRQHTDVLIVAHGSAQAPDGMPRLLSIVEMQTPGFRSFRHANLKTTPLLQTIAGQMPPHQKLLVIPFFLSNGKHVDSDIPRIMGLPRNGVAYAPPIGTHPLLAQAIIKSLEANSNLQDSGLPNLDE